MYLHFKQAVSLKSVDRKFSKDFSRGTHELTAEIFDKIGKGEEFTLYKKLGLIEEVAKPTVINSDLVLKRNKLLVEKTLALKDASPAEEVQSEPAKSMDDETIEKAVEDVTEYKEKASGKKYKKR